MFAAGSLLASGITLAADVVDPSNRFTGTFSGTGRACAGLLHVQNKTLTWQTPFSQCRKMAYEVIEQSQQGNERRPVFQLRQSNKQCLYEVLYLYHRDTTNPDINGHVIGYKTRADYTADKQDGYKANSPDTLSCYLVTQ